MTDLKIDESFYPVVIGFGLPKFPCLHFVKYEANFGPRIKLGDPGAICQKSKWAWV